MRARTTFHKNRASEGAGTDDSASSEPNREIVRGVENGMVAYVGKKANGTYECFYWQSSLDVRDVEISEDTFIIQRDVGAVQGR
jgi:hypothetical protein